MNLVIVKHCEGDRKFLFKVPDGYKISAGDAVIVDTKYGKHDGTALCDSFIANENVTEIIAKSFGTSVKDMRFVLARATVELFDVVVPNEDH